MQILNKMTGSGFVTTQVCLAQSRKVRKELQKQKGLWYLFNALCRPAIILSVAHLEGFLKDCAKALVEDLNTFSIFSSVPQPVKRTFCKLYIGSSEKEHDKAMEQRILLLIDTFDKLETKLISTPFLFDDSRNPSPSVVEAICRNFGVKDFFQMLSGSMLDIVFTGGSINVERIRRIIKDHVLSHVRSHPYTVNPRKFHINKKANAQKMQRQKTLWETFLDQLLVARYAIAHGSSLKNGFSIQEVKDYRDKVQILQFAFMLVLCDNINQMSTASMSNNP